MVAKNILKISWKTGLTTLILFLAIMIAGMIFPAPMGETTEQEQQQIMGLLFLVLLVYALLLNLIVAKSSWRGIKLFIGLLIGFYGVQTVIGQIEAFVFLTPLGEKWGAGSIPMMQMPPGFIANQFFVWGLVALIGVPFAIMLYGKFKNEGKPAPGFWPHLSAKGWLWRIGAVIILYELLYFGFGYFVAWKNPAVQEFYQGTDPGSFLAQMQYVWSETPGLPVLQFFRALLWIAFTLPVIRMLKKPDWYGALLTGLFVSLPMNIPHILPNPYMPADVSTAHFIETATSNFILGIALFLLFRTKKYKESVAGRA
mgnify:CR=1 FL=1